MWNGQQWVPIHSPHVATGPRRSPTLHFFASFILVGLGTMFAGKVAKGLVLFLLGNGAAVASVVLSVSLAHSCDLTVVAGQPGRCAPGYPGITVALVAIGLGLTALLLWVYGWFDAVASTREWNRERGWSR
jgi:hypothetical protein